MADDAWTRGDAYDRFMGRWSRQVAPPFLAWLGVPPGLRWADVGCGSGALAEAVLDTASPDWVLALDPSPAQVEEARRRLVDPRVRFACATADALEPGTLDVVVSGLVLNFVEDTVSTVAAMARAAPGGIVAAYVWDYAGGMQMLRAFWDAAYALDPVAVTLDEGLRFPLASTQALEDVWTMAGLGSVATTALDVSTPFVDFEDYWTPFLGGQGPAPGYVATLDDEARAALRQALDDRLPRAPDGSIPLTARAWAVSGRAG